MKVIVYKARDGWRWRLKSRNGRILADSGEAYTRRAPALAAWGKIARELAFRTLPVYFAP